MKWTDPQLIKTLIDNVMMDTPESRRTVLEQRACYLWPEIVGPGVNRYTLRRYVDHGILHVYLTSAPLKNELSFMRQRLVTRINEALGEEIITDLRIH